MFLYIIRSTYVEVFGGGDILSIPHTRIALYIAPTRYARMYVSAYACPIDHCFSDQAHGQPALLRLLRVIAQRRSMAVKKRDATSSGTALHLRQQAQADRALEQERRDERRALERRAALEELDAKRALELAKAEAAAERRREADTCRLARNEQDARMEKAARAAEDARWLQVDFPL